MTPAPIGADRFPPPDAEDRQFSPQGYCLEFGHDCSEHPMPDMRAYGVEGDVTYVVEYDEIVHRRCEVTLTHEDDRQFETTAAAVRFAVLEGDTDEDYETDSGTEITSWKEKK